MPRLDRPVTIRRRQVGGDDAGDVLDEIRTWASTNDGGTYEETRGSTIVGVGITEFRVRWVPFLDALRGDQDDPSNSLTAIEVEDADGRVYSPTHVVEEGRRRFHRVTGNRDLYFRSIGT